MKNKDNQLLEEAYQKVLEALYPPEVEQGLRSASQSLQTKQPLDPAVQAVIAKDPRASSGLVKMVVDSGITSNLEKHIADDVWNSIKSDNYLARELEGWLNKNNLSVQKLIS